MVGTAEVAVGLRWVTRSHNTLIRGHTLDCAVLARRSVFVRTLFVFSLPRCARGVIVRARNTCRGYSVAISTTAVWIAVSMACMGNGWLHGPRGPRDSARVRQNSSAWLQNSSGLCQNSSAWYSVSEASGNALARGERAPCIMMMMHGINLPRSVPSLGLPLT